MATMAKCISFYHWIPWLLDGKLCQHEEHHQLLHIVVKQKKERELLYMYLSIL